MNRRTFIATFTAVGATLTAKLRAPEPVGEPVRQISGKDALTWKQEGPLVFTHVTWTVVLGASLDTVKAGQPVRVYLMTGSGHITAIAGEDLRMGDYVATFDDGRIYRSTDPDAAKKADMFRRSK